MSRIRTIKPAFWKSEGLSALPPETHLLAAALLNYADDEGYFNANPKLIQGDCCQLREDKTSVRESLVLLAGDGFLRLGKGTNGKSYGHIVNFLTHQKVSHSYDSEIKDLEILWEDSGNIHGTIPERSPPEKEKEKEKEYLKGFEKFYLAYPLKRNRARAGSSYLKAIFKTTHEEIMAGLKAYIAGKEDWREWAHPATWLNGECWKDEYGTSAPEGPPLDWSDPATWHRVMRVDGKVSRHSLQYYRNNWPVPGKNFPHGCPPEILSEYWPEEIAA